jgi:putative tricarboxylic transport membrane protein
MRNKEVVSSLCWVVIGLGISIGSAFLGLGSFRRPGPGMFHFIIGCAIFLLSSCQMGAQFRKKSDNMALWPHPGGLKRVICIFLTLIFYAITLEYLGFILCTFVFLAAILKIVIQKRWGYALLVGSSVSIVTYVIFKIGLDVNLPQGLLGM